MDPTALDPVTAALIDEVKKNVKLAQTLGACGFAICLWDTLAYLHQEYRLVWQAKWSSLKLAYLFTRYTTILCGVLFFIGFFASFSASACDNFVKAMPALSTLPLLGCTGILVFRAYTLWDNNKAMLAFMLFLMVVQEVGTLTIALTETTMIPIFPSIVHACVPTSQGDLYILYWVFPIVVHTFIFIFSLVKAWDLVHSNHTSASAWSKLYKVMVTSYGLLFPVCMIIIELVQIIFYLSADEMLRAVCSPLSGFLITVLACQMVLVLKLTTKRGLSGNNHNNSSTNSHSKQGGVSTAHPTLGGGKISGIQAFVQSHQAVDGGSGSSDDSHHRHHIHSLNTGTHGTLTISGNPGNTAPPVPITPAFVVPSNNRSNPQRNEFYKLSSGEDGEVDDDEKTKESYGSVIVNDKLDDEHSIADVRKGRGARRH